MVKYVSENFDIPTNSVKIIGFAILIEHFLLGLSIMISTIISDTPQTVIDAEAKRPLVK